MVAGPRERLTDLSGTPDRKKHIGSGPGGRVVVRVGDERSGDRSGDEPRAVPQAKEPGPRPRRIRALAKRRPLRPERYTIPKRDTSGSGGTPPPTDRTSRGVGDPDEPEQGQEQPQTGQAEQSGIHEVRDLTDPHFRHTRLEPEQEGSLVDRIVEKVRAKNIHAKLPEGARISETETVTVDAGGYYDHGPNKPGQYTKPKFSASVQDIHNAIYYGQSEASDLLNFNIVSIHPYEQDPGMKQVRISFFQDEQQVDFRGSYSLAHVSAELPAAAAEELEASIKADPDRLEEFYQKTFPGLDSDGTSPGMRRLKSSGFVLLADNDLTNAGQVYRYDINLVSSLFDRLGIYRYQNGPYGTGNEILTKS